MVTREGGHIKIERFEHQELLTRTGSFSSKR